MSGIIFFKTKIIEEITQFYIREIGCVLWMDQGDCVILQHDNFLIGFCQRDSMDTQGMITFYYDNKESVDEMYEKFIHSADAPPRDNPKYPIYHFFSHDPEGRIVEFQYFYNIDQ